MQPTRTKRLVAVQGCWPCGIWKLSSGGIRFEPCARGAKQVVADPRVGRAPATIARVRPPAPIAAPRAPQDASASAAGAGSGLLPLPHDPHRLLAHGPDAPCHQQWPSSISRCASHPVHSGSQRCRKPASASRSCRGSGDRLRPGCARPGPGAVRQLGAGADGGGWCARPRTENTNLLAHLSIKIVCQQTTPSTVRESPATGPYPGRPYISGLSAQSGFLRNSCQASQASPGPTRTQASGRAVVNRGGTLQRGRRILTIGWRTDVCVNGR